MKKLILLSAMAAMIGGTAAQAQVVDPALSRDIGRAVGQAAVAAERAAAEARIAAREAMRAARQGYAEGVAGAYADAPAGPYARPGLIGTEDQAVDACAMAAEDRGYGEGFRATVRDIEGVNRLPDGWDVDGVLDARRSWRDQPAAWGFRCQVRHGQVVNVDIGHDYARR
ncbi:hypothetical protein GON01_12540 [Sphingomonas sp. MAH-20]|jgi:hypothetical protein|uniref:Uncharacterized protein n=1 Tax=Sphingomonas horti TaxID=2682842 RepID=A0A6I4J3V1_9SPHN|nr:MULTISPECIES: hypothetical protein [Sphingomonas]MBA2918727.1 hypothetical protein [Sphingomonas sp. CGMCC 1.13658]MVO78758.1 hypothetical protein [Sphingomonas horti]